MESVFADLLVLSLTLLAREEERFSLLVLADDMLMFEVTFAV